MSSRDHKVRSVGEAPRPYLHVPGGAVASVSARRAHRDAAVDARCQCCARRCGHSSPTSSSLKTSRPQQVADTTVRRRAIGAMVLGAFGALALLLAAIGLYGVVAYSVSRRTREVGIRMALGAQRGEVLRIMAARGARLAIAGLVLGALLATVAGSLLESMLYGVSAVDAIAFAAAAAVMLGVAALANLIPAAGATRIDPVRALRSE